MDSERAVDTTDVAVVGGGIAGLISAIAAAKAGARVLLFERGEHVGGTFWYSGGGIGSRSYEQFRKAIPDGDPVLQKVMAEEMPPALEWLDTLDVPVGPKKGMGFNERMSRNTHPPSFATVLGRRIELAGGTIMTDTVVEGAKRNEAGWEVTVRPAGEPSRTITSKALILAGGGFQANPELVSKYIGLDLSSLWERNSGLSDGTGLQIALANGGETAGALDTFYGHNLPAPPAKFRKEELEWVSQMYGSYIPVLNVYGRRFCDESIAGEVEEVMSQDTARQPGALAFYFFDHAIYERFVRDWPNAGYSGYYPCRDKLKNARDVGGPVWQADTLEDLIKRVGDAVTSPETALATLLEYNQAAKEGRTADLPIPKSRRSGVSMFHGGVEVEFAIPLTQPPYYCVAVRAGITFTMGGIHIDPGARVVRANGEPIPGLYAAGCDVGNVFRKFYGGGNSLGLVFGRIAGVDAAKLSKAVPA